MTINSLELSKHYPRLYFVCEAHQIAKTKVDKWMDAIRYDIECHKHGFCDSIEMMQVGIKNVIIRLERHFDQIHKILDIEEFLRDDYEHIFIRSYDYQHGYLSSFVGWRYAPVLRMMILSEIKECK